MWLNLEPRARRALRTKMNNLMEIDQSLLETLPQDQRQKIVKRMRQDQLRRYHEFERSEHSSRKQSASSPATGQRKVSKKAKSVQFGLNDGLLIALNTDDELQGEKNTTQLVHHL